MKFLLSSLEVKSISLRFLINSFYFLILSWREIEFDLKNAFCDQNMTALGRLGKWMRPQEKYFYQCRRSFLPRTQTELELENMFGNYLVISCNSEYFPRKFICEDMGKILRLICYVKINIRYISWLFRLNKFQFQSFVGLKCQVPK